jgi:hypothetical protein
MVYLKKISCCRLNNRRQFRVGTVDFFVVVDAVNARTIQLVRDHLENCFVVDDDSTSVT